MPAIGAGPSNATPFVPRRRRRRTPGSQFGPASNRGARRNSRLAARAGRENRRARHRGGNRAARASRQAGTIIPALHQRPVAAGLSASAQRRTARSGVQDISPLERAITGGLITTTPGASAIIDPTPTNVALGALAFIPEARALSELGVPASAIRAAITARQGRNAARALLDRARYNLTTATSTGPAKVERFGTRPLDRVVLSKPTAKVSRAVTLLDRDPFHRYRRRRLSDELRHMLGLKGPAGGG